MLSLMRAGAVFFAFALAVRTRSDGRQRVRCAVVRLRPENEDWTEEIWVDPLRHIVLKSIIRKKTPFGSVLTETEWRNMELNGAIDHSLFRLVPPQGAIRTNAISIP